MKIIYSCYGGAHTSIVASAIHLGILSDQRVPSNHDIMKIPYYDATESKNIGSPLFMGIDQGGNEIYVLGMGPSRRSCTSLIYDFSNLMAPGEPKRVLIVNSIALINLPIRIGGFLSRRVKLVSLGKPLTAAGIRKKYMAFVSLVNNVKDAINHGNNG